MDLLRARLAAGLARLANVEVAPKAQPQKVVGQAAGVGVAVLGEVGVAAKAMGDAGVQVTQNKGAVEPAVEVEENSMSFITAIEGDAHTFAAWAEGELGKLSTEAPAITKVVDTIVQYIGGTASILAGVEGGPAASTAVTSAVSAIQTGLTALSGLVADFGATPTAASMAASLATNANVLLTAAKVTNQTSVKAATGIISNLNTLATALSSAAAKPSQATA